MIRLVGSNLQGGHPQALREIKYVFFIIIIVIYFFFFTCQKVDGANLFPAPGPQWARYCQRLSSYSVVCELKSDYLHNYPHAYCR